MSKPILVMQMQRMGDLILSFPLFLWLERQFPGRRILVLAERAFYEPLMSISPAVTYFPWEGAGELRKRSFELVLNLSIRDQAASLAAELDADEKLGPLLQADGSRYVRGGWQLYRASLVANNRYNRFHWADLNALDVIDFRRMARTAFSEPRPPVAVNPDEFSVGLFLGASEKAKRPSPAFWAELCVRLLERGIRPALFGGPAEKHLGNAVRTRFGRPLPNLCGKFGLKELVRAMGTLQLFITPDTGPMHLASWTGCRTLNLSMGPVHPFETGPYPPGHAVLRADMDCARGCWHCTRDRLHCHDPMTPEAVAAVAARMARGTLPANPPPGLRLYETARPHGLHALRPVGPREDGPFLRTAVFWRNFLAWRLGLWGEDVAASGARLLRERAPERADDLAAALPGLLAGLRRAAASGIPASIWETSPAPLKPLTGWAELSLQNENHSPAAYARMIETRVAARARLGG
ncbi:MAG: glycosyltransferase family 9 protein [Desulfovibrionaceae bacterium]